MRWLAMFFTGLVALPMAMNGGNVIANPPKATCSFSGNDTFLRSPCEIQYSKEKVSRMLPGGYFSSRVTLIWQDGVRTQIELKSVMFYPGKTTEDYMGIAKVDNADASFNYHGATGRSCLQIPENGKQICYW